MEYSTSTLSGNTVASNRASEGGGLYLYSGTPTLSGNTIVSNIADSDGGGLYLDGGASTLSGNKVMSNTAARGGGLFLYVHQGILMNNLVADNRANSQGSGMYIGAGSTRMLHTTVARNSGGDGSGIYITDVFIPPCVPLFLSDRVGQYSPEDCIEYFSTVALTNTILVSHTVGIAVVAGNTATLEVTLWGSRAWADSTNWSGDVTIITGTHNYWGDPAFVNPSAGDYHIGPTSAAIDKGVNAGVTVDLDGNLRPAGRFPDIGAYEFFPCRECKHVYLPLVLKNHS